MPLESLELDANGRSAQPGVVVHCCRGRQAYRGEEVSLSPELSFLEASAALLAGRVGGVAFVESPLPVVDALGALPAGYVNAQPVSSELLCQLFEQQHLLRLEPASSSNDGESPLATSAVAVSEVQAWAAHIQGVMGPAIELALWGHTPCYMQHTRPAAWHGAATIGAGVFSRLLLRSYCRRRRQQARRKLRDVHASHTLAKLSELLGVLQTHLGSSGFLHGTEPQLDDIMLFAYSQVLTSIPEICAPWAGRVPLGLDRLHRFVKELEPLLDARRKMREGLAMPTCSSRSSWELLMQSTHQGSDEVVEIAGVGITSRKPSVVRASQQLLEFGEGAAASCMSPVANNSRNGASWWRRFVGGISFPTASGSVDQKEPPRGPPTKQEQVSRSQIRVNAIFVVWWMLSMGGFAYWRWRRPPVNKDSGGVEK